MFEGIPVATLSPSILLGITVLLLLMGKLVPRVILTDKQKECDQWREAYEKEREARGKSDSQTVELLELAKTTHDIIAATYSAGARIQRGAPDVVQPQA